MKCYTPNMTRFSFLKKSRGKTSPKTVFLTNTLSGKKERFVPQDPHLVTLYSCGPTVYSRAHIGNLRPHVCADTLTRTLIHAGYHVRRVINITDVGHLVSDGDMGEDKIEMSAKKKGLSVEVITERYTKTFLEDLEEINIHTKNILFPRATEYIHEQISLAHTLEEKGFAYRINDGLYFDTSRFVGYGKLSGVKNATQQAGIRVAINTEKRHPADFSLWKTTPKGVSRLQEWDSPWGRGAPGWHLECSSMVRSLLGVEIDIHTGGMDLAPVHHNNEIAQSEAANDRPFAHYWIHNAFLTIHGDKISKSLGNVIYLSDITKHGFQPLSLRYFFHQAHYRTPLSFTEEALKSSNDALKKLWRLARTIKASSNGKETESEALKYFTHAVRDDLNTPKALGILWETLRDDDMTAREKWGVLVAADALLGLQIVNPPITTEPISETSLPKDVRTLLTSRDSARETGDFTTADKLREKLIECGYRVEDSEQKTLLFPDV